MNFGIERAKTKDVYIKAGLNLSSSENLKHIRAHTILVQPNVIQKYLQTKLTCICACVDCSKLNIFD